MCRHAIRRLEATNWQNTILEKKMNNVAEKLTKKLDMTVALQKAEASAWANHKEGMILDMNCQGKGRGSWRAKLHA